MEEDSYENHSTIRSFFFPFKHGFLFYRLLIKTFPKKLPRVNWQLSSRMNSLEWSKKQENCNYKSLESSLWFLCQIAVVVPSFFLWGDKFGHLTFLSEITQRSRWYSSSVLLLQGFGSWVFWRDLSVDSELLQCSASLPLCCTVLAILLDTSLSPLIYYTFQHACGTFYFLFQCLRMYVVCSCL